MSRELDDLANRAEDAGFPTLAEGYRRDAQLIREFGGPEYFDKPDHRFYTYFTSLPEISDSRIVGIVRKVNPVLGLKDDSTPLDYDEITEVIDPLLDKHELPLFHRPFSKLCRQKRDYSSDYNYLVTFGDVRGLTENDMKGIRQVGKKGIAIIMHSLQPLGKIQRA